MEDETMPKGDMLCLDLSNDEALAKELKGTKPGDKVVFEVAVEITEFSPKRLMGKITEVLEHESMEDMPEETDSEEEPAAEESTEEDQMPEALIVAVKKNGSKSKA